MSVTVANTTASLSGKTLAKLEDTQTITGLKTFDLGASAPFAVVSGAAVVPNLDADKLDGSQKTDFAVLADPAAFLSTVSVAGALSPLALVNISGASAGQVQFPAAQNASSNANTLDDYEEGTWTPVIGGSGGTSGQTYATQVGLYVKIGQLVTATFSVQLSNKGTITTNVQISGLPFAAHASFGGMTAIGWSSLAATKVIVMAEIAGGDQVASIYGIGAAAAGVFTNLVTADIDNSTILRGTLCYRAAA